MNKTVVICTGQPGAGRDEYLHALKSRKDFHYYHLFDYIVDEAEKQGFILNKLNVLDFYDSKPDLLESFRSSALKRIIEEISKRDGVHMISTPYHFEWKGKSYEGLRQDEVKSLNPDILLVTLDDLIRVRERLKKDPQWREHDFTLVELAQWRRAEIMGVYELSRLFTPHKEFYLVAREHGTNLLEDLIFHREKKKIYLSHPITGEDEQFFRNVQRFAKSLKPYYTVFDPYMIKDWDVVETWRRVKNRSQMKGEEVPRKIGVTIEYTDGVKRYELESWDIETAIKNIRAQIIDTDYRIIESCHYIVVYHPREEISAGVMSEMIQAKAMAKFVYVFYPYEPSPFFEWYSTKIFSRENELVSFLKEIAGKELSS